MPPEYQQGSRKQAIGRSLLYRLKHSDPLVALLIALIALWGILKLWSALMQIFTAGIVIVICLGLLVWNPKITPALMRALEHWRYNRQHR